MSIQVTCSCGKQFRVSDQSVGKRGKCPKCGKILTIVGDSHPNADVFISYSHTDQHIADAICAALESQKIRCWIAPRNLAPGSEWGQGIIQGINQCRVFVLVFSSASNDSVQVRREVERAVAKNLVIIPFRLEEISLNPAMEYFLSSPHWLDAITKPVEQHITRLVKTVSQVCDQAPISQKATSSTVVVTPAQPGFRVERRILLGSGAAAVVGAIGLTWWWSTTPKADPIQSRLDWESEFQAFECDLLGHDFEWAEKEKKAEWDKLNAARQAAEKAAAASDFTSARKKIVTARQSLPNIFTLPDKLNQRLPESLYDLELTHVFWHLSDEGGCEIAPNWRVLEAVWPASLEMLHEL